MISTPVTAGIVVVCTATSFFFLGAYYQHHNALRQLRYLIQNDPYAFHIRHKLYELLKIFSFDVEQFNKDCGKARMPEIMKYGFPGLDDVRLYDDFVLSYDRRNRVAHWVYEHLTATCVGNDHGISRQEAEFQADLRVPSNFRASVTDYKNSGYDRGHLAAAANHKCQQTHCNETFYLTNIAPQVGKGFNRDAWNNLEIYVRELTERYGSVYVCTGPLYLPKKQPNDKWIVEYETIGANTVAVPTHFYKVIIVESKLPAGNPYMEAYVMPNAPIPSTTPFRAFLCDIRDIERGAGLQFFKGLRRSFFLPTNSGAQHPAPSMRTKT